MSVQSSFPCALFSAAFLLIFPVSLAAAPLSPADHNTIEQQQKALLEQAQQQRDSLQGTSPPPRLPDAPALTEDSRCYALQRVEVSGVTVLSRSAQTRFAAVPTRGCMTFQNIRQRVRDITQAYLEKGYITSSAWLPEQDISAGRLNIAVTEGRVESVRIEGEKEAALRMAFPGVEGQVLNLRDLEQGLERLNRLASRQLTIDILPGSTAGYSQVQLIPTRPRFPVSLTFGADNSGQKSTGRGQMNAGLVADNLLRLADQWSLSAVRDSEFHHDRRSRSLQAGVTLPYGYWLFSAQYGWSDFYQPVSTGQSSASWRYDGRVQTQRATVNRTLWRDGKQRLALDVDFTRRKTENSLGGVRLNVSSPTLTSLTTGLNYSRSLAGGWLTVGPAFAHGLGIAGATEDDPAHPSLPRSEYRRFSLNGSWFYPVTPSLYWLTSVYGQTTPDTLYASERISVGGQYSVRGFKEQYLTGNRGGYWRNELTWQWLTLLRLGTLSLTGALDVGHVMSENGKIAGGNVVGSSLGLELSGRWFTQSLSVGFPLAWPDSLSPDKPVVYWQATLAL
ncbi:hemolysin activation/secretion protein [Klebsiella oxytoca]|uniref:Hemolysin activation/secretion protein n=1 Tax=Klebsiella oxytoca TaxID=571 RepID=A0A318FAZ2_KLEOX|nr:ShlB/FhaC/HecB family hemolysin secretion/activation protein [Klebsiella oxytoca]PXW36458.1 hemolysin activation/secretion protein [Klebsiella oxytoca]